MHLSSLWRWILLCALILTIILVPFFTLGSGLETWTHRFLETSQQHQWWTALILSALLAGDILLPVPSSVVSTGAGFLLGFAGGTIASFAGMTMGCLIGYALGFNSRRTLAARWLKPEDLVQLEGLFRRCGDWTIVAARPVPVLAEASVLFAGLGRMSARRFMTLATLSNLGISAVYAMVGAFSVSVNSFLLAFAGALIVPGVAMYFLRNHAFIAAPVEVVAEDDRSRRW